MLSFSVGHWETWESMVTEYIYPDSATPDFNSILVPVVENVCINYMIESVAKQGKAVLIIGEQGSAKTVMMKAFMKRQSPDVYVSRSFNFSSATTPQQFQVSFNIIN